MTELLTAAQMRATEQEAISSGHVTGLELMERAGARVVEAVFEEWPELGQRAHRAVVLCGPGNNGGDGFVIARLLHERGWEVEVLLYGEAKTMPPDARKNFEKLPISTVTLNDDLFDGREVDTSVDLVVDAIFGTGLSRPFLSHRHTNMWVNSFQSLRKRVVAVDVPSGLCADSGQMLGDDQPVDFAGIANLTVSFHTAKVGHVLADGPAVCGKVVVKDIGLPPSSLQKYSIARLVDGARLERLDKKSGHKFSHGHALILSGGAGHTGAARLAARGALRVGAGLVTLIVPGSAQMEVASQVTAIMQRRVDDGAGLAEVLQDARLNALCLGPGLGLQRACDLVPVALGRGGVKPRPTVLDADALTCFADAPGDLFEALHEDCVLTPHGGEFARLFPDIADRLAAPAVSGPAYSKVDATREAAARAGCVVLFKGPDTVIAAPDGRCSVNAAVYDRAAPWLATAGSGDVLAGFITGLLARGVDPFEAAETAAWLHVDCALSFGPGLIAEDLPEEVPKVFRALGL